MLRLDKKKSKKKLPRMEMLTFLWVNDEYDEYSLPGLNTKIHTTKEKTKYRIISYANGRITQYLQMYLKQLL